MTGNRCPNAVTGLCRMRTIPYACFHLGQNEVDTELQVERQPQPIFNLPRAIQVFAGFLVAVHALRAIVPPDMDTAILLRFAFLPVRYVMEGLPGGALADVWTFATYAFLHGDVMHLLINLLWLVAFGSPVAWRFGPLRFAAFVLASAIGGSAVHLATNWAEMAPMVGASAVISGLMAAAMRFAFADGASLGSFRTRGPGAYRRPAMSLVQSFNDPRVLTFIGVWLAINLLFGAGSIGIAGADQAIAWQAHVGGFAVGLFLFPLFDPIRRGGAPDPRQDAA